VAPEWHGWLHHTWQDPPTEAPLPRQSWEKPHVPNLTGTVAAYHPPGSILAATPQARADYEAWVPE
jgi:NADH:ubiquinone oxidoreductase subunit